MSLSKPFVLRHAGLALLALACAAPAVVLAQNPQPAQPEAAATAAAPAPAQDPADADKAPGAKNQRIERIHVQDNNATVDELRVGGQTQSITVKPNSNAPAYQVMPNANEHTRGQGQPDTATSDSARVWWNVFKF